MQTRVVVPPEQEPVTVEEVKVHARIPLDLEDDGLDAYLAGQITAGRLMLESRFGFVFMLQTLETTWGGDLCEREGFRLPRAPIASIVSLGYRDSAGEDQLLDEAEYLAELGTPGTIAPAYGARWPSGDPTVVRYTAGVEDPADVREDHKLIIKMLVAGWYSRREPVVTGTIVAKLPFTIDALCDSLRWGAYPQ